ncbi:MAG: rhodanese-like domain-containing protein [Ignavibacteriales bacterium]|nr:rhodanese-like domain-containing protein [Ignavibacteriales bacterium]
MPGLFSFLKTDSHFNLDTESFAKRIEENKSCEILDVRTPEEFGGGHIPGSKNIDFYEDDFRNKIESLDKTKTFFVYCRSGSRSYSSVKHMLELGFQEVFNLNGGIIKWRGQIEK